MSSVRILSPEGVPEEIAEELRGVEVSLTTPEPPIAALFGKKNSLLAFRGNTLVLTLAIEGRRNLATKVKNWIEEDYGPIDDVLFLIKEGKGEYIP